MELNIRADEKGNPKNNVAHNDCIARGVYSSQIIGYGVVDYNSQCERYCYNIEVLKPLNGQFHQTPLLISDIESHAIVQYPLLQLLP
jgi:hypothetical protein